MKKIDNFSFLIKLFYTMEQTKTHFDYPHFWKISHNIDFLILLYEYIENGARLTDTNISLIGRVLQKRESSKKLIFYTILINGDEFQVISDLNSYINIDNQDKFEEIHDKIKLGDIIGIEGYIGKGKRGELSIFPRLLKILAPCLHDIPSTYYGIEDKELRYSNRYLDMIINKNVRNIFNKRHQIIKFLREEFYNKDFIEVETPILANSTGGASAKPFITYHNDMKQNMFMRIAPELFLKQLVIGGLWKVFEIGKQFRNESIDMTHMPEFTSCEAYCVGTDYNWWMNFTEKLFENMAIKINNTTKTTWFGQEINLQGPYPRLDIMNTLEKCIQEKLNDQSFKLPNLEEEEYLKLVEVLNIKITKPHTLNRLVDGLIGEFVEPLCIQPTFLINHPQIMSPLAKHHRTEKGKTERFELFINKKEFCNAYTELNDPNIQKTIFEEIMKQKTKGDDEIPQTDNNFVKALEYGLPPTGGWGIGIDRLVMLLTGQDSIREVICFPTRKIIN